MSSLVDFFRTENESYVDERIEEVIQFFENNLCDEKWRPDDPFWFNLSKVVEYGTIGLLIRGDDVAEQKLKSIVRAFQTKSYIDKTALSELHCAAMLRCLGWGPRFVKESNFRTPDLFVSDLGYEAEIEVVRSDEKRSQHELAEKIQIMSGAIGVPSFGCIFIYIDVELTKEIEDKIIDAVVNGGVPSLTEVEADWAVIIGAPEEREKFVANQMSPNWLRKGARSIHVGTSLGGAGDSAPLIHISVLIQEDDYLNPIRRKAERPQRLTDLPYVVSADISETPNAFEAIDRQADGFWTLWDHVSAVILFHPILFVGKRLIWRFRILLNAYAEKAVTLPFDVPDSRIEIEPPDKLYFSRLSQGR